MSKEPQIIPAETWNLRTRFAFPKPEQWKHVRYFSPKEMANLMGFPDDWSLPGAGSNVIEGDLDFFCHGHIEWWPTDQHKVMDCHFVWKDLQSARGNHCKYCQTASFVGFEGRQSQHKASHWLVQAVWSAAHNGGWWGILSMSLWSPAFWDVCCDGLGTRKHRIAKMTAVI